MTTKTEEAEETEELSPYWCIVTPDKGICLTLGYLYEPPNSFAVQRLCDQTVIRDTPEVRRLLAWELPSCKKCRAILVDMKKDGQR